VRRWLRKVTPGALTAMALALPLHGQDARRGFAVLPFENSGSYGQDKKLFQALQLSIPADISSALAAHPGVVVIDAGRVGRAAGSQGIGPGQRVDASTAAQLAKTLGTRYIVTGSFTDFYGKLRINARLVDAESGQIVTVVANDDPKLQDRDKLAAIIGDITERLIAAAGP
jgi:TolB-like protein